MRQGGKVFRQSARKLFPGLVKGPENFFKIGSDRLRSGRGGRDENEAKPLVRQACENIVKRVQIFAVPVLPVHFGAEDGVKALFIPAGGEVQRQHAGTLFQKALAAVGNILPAALEVPGVPGVRHGFPGAAGVFHEQMEFSGRIRPEKAAHVPQIGLIHADEQVIFFIVVLYHAPCPLTGAVNAMLREQPGRGGIDAAAEFVRMSGSGSNFIFRLKPCAAYQILHYKFGGGAAADVAVADK